MGQGFCCEEVDAGNGYQEPHHTFSYFLLPYFGGRPVFRSLMFLLQYVLLFECKILRPERGIRIMVISHNEAIVLFYQKI